MPNHSFQPSKSIIKSAVPLPLSFLAISSAFLCFRGIDHLKERQYNSDIVRLSRPIVELRLVISRNDWRHWGGDGFERFFSWVLEDNFRWFGYFDDEIASLHGGRRIGNAWALLTLRECCPHCVLEAFGFAKLDIRENSKRSPENAEEIVNWHKRGLVETIVLRGGWRLTCLGPALEVAVIYELQSWEYQNPLRESISSSRKSTKRK